MKQAKPAVVVPPRSLSKRRVRTYRLGAVTLSLLVSLVAVEAGLRILEKRQLRDRVIEQWIVPDPELGKRMTPNAAGHDANGFRNDSVPTRADIVAIGDSQTWGVNVDRQDAWPQQLAKLSGHSVYNMSLGGYGPVQYWVLAGRTQKLSAPIIIVGLYFGNDFYDAYRLVYTNPNYRELRAPSASADLENDTIASQADLYWNEEKSFHKNFGRTSLSGLSYWAREHLAIGRLLNRTGLWPGATDVDYEIDKAWARAHPDHGAVCEDTAIRTVFTTAYRLTGLDLDDPRVSEGLRITKEVLWRAQQKADKSGVKLLVLMIPTKELVYADQMQRGGKLTGTYAHLIEMENRARNEVASACVEKHLACIDALPDLRGAIAHGQQIYPSTTESHPNAAGYRVLATTVNEALKN